MDTETAARTARSLLEIHDVCPDYFPRVAALMARCAERGVLAVIAVIPGGPRPWARDQIHALQRWQRGGHVIALHGLTHMSPRLRSPFHRLHQATFSRLAAENLGLARDTVLERTMRGIGWFREHDFGVPSLYVPPAWTLGPVTPHDFGSLGIRTVERINGFSDAATGRFIVWPVVGFEADSVARAVCLTMWNLLAHGIGIMLGRYRIVAHPRDAELLLRGALDRQLRAAACVDPVELFAAPRASPLLHA